MVHGTLGTWTHIGALSIPFLKRSRGKRSVALDITEPAGASLVRTMAEHSDVLVENSRADAMEHFGLGYEQLAAANPGVPGGPLALTWQ